MRELTNPGAVYQKLMDFMERLARLGLIHCDFNEFNVMVGGLGRKCPQAEMSIILCWPRVSASPRDLTASAPQAHLMLCPPAPGTACVMHLGLHFGTQLAGWR